MHAMVAVAALLGRAFPSFAIALLAPSEGIFTTYSSQDSVDVTHEIEAAIVRVSQTGFVYTLLFG
jgi:hypothetical protein